MNAPSRAVLEASQRAQPNAPEDKLVALQSKAAEARDLQQEIDDLSEQLKDKKAKLHVLEFEVMPNMMEQLKLDKIGVPSSGNHPGIDYELKPFFSASIAAKWPDDKKEEAFAFLKARKAESLIKTQVTAALPKGNLPAAKKILAAIKKMKVSGAKINLAQSVHKSTLTAWLKEIYDNGQSLPPDDLAKIGGSVGRYVKPSGRDDNKIGGEDE